MPSLVQIELAPHAGVDRRASSRLSRRALHPLRIVLQQDVPIRLYYFSVIIDLIVTDNHKTQRPHCPKALQTQPPRCQQ